MSEVPLIADLGACPCCGALCNGRQQCEQCGRRLPWDAGIWMACNPLCGNNQVAARFYDSPAWDRFRPWERRFLGLVGGRRGARKQILQHLAPVESARILEVGIGDGENLDLLPRSPTIYGVDISRVQLRACLARYPDLENRLAHAEAENLPFPNATFDAAFSIGGFNYFNDPVRAFRELKRVTRPGGIVLVADERPDLKTWGIGHLVGWKSLDVLWLRRLGLPRDFAEVVVGADPGILRIVREQNPESRQLAIWRRLGYCLVDRVDRPKVGSSEPGCP